MKSFYVIFFILFFRLTQLDAQTASDSLLRVTVSGSEKDKLNAYLQLGNLYKYNDPQKALDYVGQAMSIAEQQSDEGDQAKTYQAYAGILFRLGNFNKSKEYYIKAFNVYVSLQNDKGKAETQNALAGIYYAQGNIGLAVQNYLDVLRYYENKNDKVGLVNIYTSLANLYARQNNFTKSIEYNLKAIELYESSSNKLQAIVVYDQIGNAYLRQNNLSKSIEFFNKSLKSYTEMNNQAGVASTLNMLGNIAVEQNENERAEGFFLKSLAIAEQTKTPYLKVINLNALAHNYTVQRLYPKAIECYKKAINIAKPGNMKLELEESYQGLSTVYALTKQQNKATTFGSLSREIKDSIYNDSTLKQLSNLQLRYESEKKQQQIELLSKEQQMKDIELASERELNRIFLYASLLIAFVFLILVYALIQNKKYASSLQKQKSELEQKAFEISLQKEKVDQLNSVKDRFFSIISHDLRNNLTTMKLYFDLISNPNYQPEDQTEITKQISGSVENTIDLLENLLVWASAQIKGIPIHIQKLNMHTMAQENISLLSGNASQKQVTLVNEIDEHVSAFGDMDMINLVLRNLISNAIKFTPEKGCITVSSKVDEQNCTVTVADNGIGISDENIPRLFDQHLHPTTKGTGNEKGTGLGLLLCKDFIEQNNGRIWAESEKGDGSKFYFTLPLRYAEG